ncbi:secreted lipase [Dissophora ornata]|nr:secreted lipase [Dissophora ornata]
MRFLTALSSSAIALATLALFTVNASPVPRTTEGMQLSKRSTSGWNDWSCTPSSAHPKALILVHGLLANADDNWLYMAPRFKAQGYCVFALTYGQMNGVSFLGALDKMENSAQQLSDYVDKVLAATNTTQVDIFAHSEGSLMPRYYLRFLNGASKVHKFATIGSIQYGTTLDGIVKLADSLGLYDAIKKLLQNSTFIQNLNAGGDTVPGVQYLMVGSKYDEIVTPYTTGFLRDNNPNVKNQVLQDWCSLDYSEHILQMFDPVAFNGAHAFFTPAADQTISCLDLLQ